jgi:hypothetical protein
MSNVQLIVSSVNTAKKNLGDLLLTFQLKKKTGSTYTNGKNSPTFATDMDIQGIYDKFEYNELESALVLITDTKLILFIDDKSQVPIPGDIILDGEVQYQVIRPSPVYAGATVVLCIVQVRT